MINTRTFNIPILFIVFNRLDTTKQVFAKIKEITPERLYIASDGPRSNRPGESETVNSIREFILNSIDWNCEIKTLFREKNLGCGKAVSTAISWFFENEDMGIILEDDCLPSISFFPYCRELLEKYRDNQRIFHITGHNPLTLTKMPYSYYFSRIQHCWGWASWKRAFEHYSFEITDLDVTLNNKNFKRIFHSKEERLHWIDVFRKMEKHQIDTWDHQWTYAIIKNNGLCINPAKNLVSNLGFNNEATHTLDSSSIYNRQPSYEINNMVHPCKIKIDTSLIKKISKVAFNIDISISGKFKRMIPSFIKYPVKKLIS